jgi:hypothetical protein
MMMEGGRQSKLVIFHSASSFRRCKVKEEKKPLQKALVAKEETLSLPHNSSVSRTKKYAHPTVKERLKRELGIVLHYEVC